jgi:general stress protein CsbA
MIGWAIVGAVVVALLVVWPGLFRPVAWAARVVGWVLLAAGILAAASGALAHTPVVVVIEGFAIAVGMVVAGRRSGRWMRRRSAERWVALHRGPGWSPDRGDAAVEDER